jgi:hypothetical protein
MVIHSTEEFDRLIASHKGNGQFIKLSYGLIPARKYPTGKDDTPTVLQINNNSRQVPKSFWWQPDSALIKSFITIGSFLSTD